MNGRRRLLSSFNHGSMANASPQAIGAQIFHPGRQVVTLSGDGGFSMLMGDLLSLRQLYLPVQVVVFNNGSLGFVELEMKATGFLKHCTDLVILISRRLRRGRDRSPCMLTIQKFCPALEQAMAHDGPALVDIAVNRQELAMPPSLLKLDQIVDFNLYMIKAIFERPRLRNH